MQTTIFTPEGVPADKGAVEQLERCMEHGDALAGVLCADHHLGYSAPIGAAIAYPEHVSPSGVGYDIGCGNKAVATELPYAQIARYVPKIMDEIARRVSFGMGRVNDEPIDHEVIESIGQTSMTSIRQLQPLAAKQLGTVGAGNHYVDLFRDEDSDMVWIGVHFGSRGFGHKIASGFLSLAGGLRFDERTTDGEMHSPPVLIPKDSDLGQSYIEAMTLAGAYAYAGRDVVVDKVLEILGTKATYEVHNHHNFAWEEQTPFGKAWVVRKGSTPLWPGQLGFVGGSMGENAVIIQGSVIVQGNLASAADNRVGESALWSAPHGAGRAMSRTEAAGKKKRRVYCRSCGWVQGAGVQKPTDDRCPSCLRYGNLNRKWITLARGKIDWQETLSDLHDKNIVLRGGAADEAPGAYKRLPAVLEAHAAHIDIIHQLVPIGVAMASSDTYDPFKD